VSGALRLGFIGAGNYASSMLLPHLAQREDVELVHVVTNTSLSAANAQRRFGFTEASTDVERLLGDDSIDGVFVVTRHHTHADLVCRALEAGKATFVEKPLALDDEQLDRIVEVVETSGNDRLMVGFNRRFAPILTSMRSRFGTATHGAIVRYMVNAGPLGASSWYQNSALEGSRFAGEGGHFIDTISWWLGARPTEVLALTAADPDDLHVAVHYDDGSVASIDYATHGNPRYPKETFEASAAGRTARLDNFGRTTIWTGRRRSMRRSFGAVDKGQARQVAAFVDAVRRGQPMPISLESLVETTAATLAVGESLATGSSVKLTSSVDRQK
jgi:predicted dehydrogenase